MKRELLRGFTMLMLIIAVAFVTAVATAQGQANDMKANIPFEFSVGSQSLPEGEYRIESRSGQGDVVGLSRQDNTARAMRLTIPKDGRSEHAKLVFHRYGDRYFLAEVWDADRMGRQVTRSKQERAIE